MATNREKLEEKAKALDVEFDPEITDDNLLKLINEAQNKANNSSSQASSGRSFNYYKSKIDGLAVQVGAPEHAGTTPELHQEVKFTSYLQFDERHGDHYRIGLLETDDPDVVEALADDPNVEQITKKQYKELIDASNKLA
jgi:hypothetical protein